MKLPERILPIATLIAILCATPGGPIAFARAQSGGASTQPAAPAGQTTPITLEPVRVTADLWELPLDRISASASVYGDAELRTRAVMHFSDLASQIPNFTWSGGASRPRYFQIRGIGENSQFEGETPDSTVRFLIDDLDFTGLGTLGSTFDVAQVEVLRGPQAGAFGANAAGGTVRLVTQAPAPFWGGRIEGTVGEDGLRSGGFAIGGPLLAGEPHKLMARLAVHQSVSDGFRRNVTLNRDTNARDEFSARLRLAFNPSPAWAWEAAVLVSDVDNGYDEFALDNNGRFTFSDQPGRDRQESRAASLRGTYTGIPSVRLTSVTGGSWIDSAYSYDDDWTAASYRGFSDLRRERTGFTQEFRMDSAEMGGTSRRIDRWTLGVHFSRMEEQGAYTNEDPGNVRGLRTHYESGNAAVFGQVAGDLGRRSRLIVGLRMERIETDGWGTRTRFRKGPGTFDPAVGFSPGFDDTIIGGKVTLEHALGPQRMAFASVTRGYKGGGINIDARINPPGDPLSYATEYLWNYEAGLRGNWLGERFRGELSVFHLQRRDSQVRDSAGFGGSYRFFTDNAESSRISGMEASGMFALTPRWSMNGTLALMDSWLDPFTLSNGNAGGGRRLANTPPYGYSAGVRYDGAPGFFGQVELIGRARQFDSNNHDEARRSFNVVNLSIGYSRGDWTLTLWARNLLDRLYDKRVYYFGNEDPDYLPARYETHADPRQVGVTAAYRF